MADISHHQFIALLKKSNVIDAKKLQPWLEENTKIESARKLAKSLVQLGFLTTWQAKFLISGRYRLRIGNYFLLSRLRRDELGARYLAIHATLKRKVELQIFSRDLTSDTKRWKDMIKKASLVAKLDHSSLVHVYDIDHDDDRYFLVVEHVPGRSLDVQKEIFTTPQIGKLVLQCAEGVEFAHQNNVVHGTIDQSDIVLTEKGTVKLQNLTVSPMRNQNNDEPEAKPSADFKALAKLGKKLLSANPGADGGAGAELLKIFALMNAKGVVAMAKLRKWVEGTPDPEATSAQVTKSGANPIFQSSSSEVDSSSTSKVTYAPDAPDEAEEAGTSSASIIAAAKASPPFLIACALGLAVFGGIVTYGVSRAYSKMAAEPAAKVSAADAEEAKAERARAAKHEEMERKQVEAWEADQKKDAAGKAGQSGGHKKARTPTNERVRANPKPDAKNDEKPASQDAAPDKDAKAGAMPREAVESKPTVEEDGDSSGEATAESDPPKENAEGNKFLNIFGYKKKKGTTEKDEKADPAKEGAVPEIAKDVESDDLEKLTHIGKVTENALYAGGVRTYKQILEMNPEALDKVLEKSGGNKLGAKWEQAIADAKPLAEEVAELAKEHFRKVPDAFDLPSIKSTDAKVLTKLEIPGNYFLSIELVSPVGIGQRRLFFELSEDSSVDEKWIVSSKKSRKSKVGVGIASFQKKGNEFVFAWTPEAANDKTAVYLKNCFVRLSTPDGRTRFSKLRKPNKSIRSLRISKENLIDELSFEIDALPSADRIKIQLGTLSNQERTIEVHRPAITFEAPAIVKLKSRESGGFMNMQVSAKRSARSIKLTAGLFLRGTPIKSYDQLVSFEKQLEAANVSAQLRARGKKENSPELKQASIAKANADRMADYKKSIDWLLDGGGEAIDFEVVADFEDGRVMLAKSDKKVIYQSKKKKK